MELADVIQDLDARVTDEEEAWLEVGLFRRTGMGDSQKQICPIRVAQSIGARSKMSASMSETGGLDIWVGASFALVPAPRVWRYREERNMCSSIPNGDAL